MSPTYPVDNAALVAFAQQLVQTPSVSTQEAEVASLVADEMRRLGFEVHRDRMGNVLGRIGAGTGPRLVFDAHMDTVDVGDSKAWARDPYGGDIEQGILHGRGAADMKGALAAMVYGAAALANSGTSLKGDLYVLAVVQEEPCEGLAIKHAIEEEDLRPNWVVLGEPTNLQLSRGQRGRIEVEITVRGRSCHASSPERGVNAIYEATRLIVGLELLAPQLARDSFLGRGSIAVTEISSQAGSRNAIPDTCTLCVDRRLTAGETETRALAEIRRILTREGVDADLRVPTYVGTSYTGHRAEAVEYFPSWTTSPDEPLLTTAVAAIESVTGYTPRIGRWEFSTDGVFTAGAQGIPTIGFGPGEERYAHTSEEQIRVRDMTTAASVYAQLGAAMLAKR